MQCKVSGRSGPGGQRGYVMVAHAGHIERVGKQARAQVSPLEKCIQRDVGSIEICADNHQGHGLAGHPVPGLELVFAGIGGEDSACSIPVDAH